MTSKLIVLPSASTISATSGVTLPASFLTGMTTDTAGGVSLRVSFMIIRCVLPPTGGCGCFLWGQKLPGNPFDAPQ